MYFVTSYLNNVVVKEQPEAVTLHNGDVVSTVGTTAAQRGETMGSGN